MSSVFADHGISTAGVLEMRRCGDSGLLLEVADNTDVHPLAEALCKADIAGVSEIVPAMRTVLVVIDPAITNLERVEVAARAISPSPRTADTTNEVVIGVQYDGEDLDFVAAHTGLGVTGVIKAHTSTPWQVAFCGFAPGFAYLIGGDPRLEVPRRGESRVRVPPGSVALAGHFASVYPRESPGGWQLIGRTEDPLWDVERTPPTLLTPGTTVRFRDLKDDLV